jgi:L-iditol 2-dehydrogenase
VKALEKTAPGRGNVALVEKEPRAPLPGEVVLEVHAAGVCGTDLHIVEDEYRSFPPVTMGHEVAGVVVELGDGVDPGWLGTRVVCETYYSTCGACAYCRDGRPNLCGDRRSIGSGADGAFAARLALPATCLHPIPGWLPDHAAALAEPLACVCNSLCDPPVVSPGDDVLVTGPGPIGLLAAQVARAAGGRVLVVGAERDEVRLAKARGLGFDTGGPAASDVAIECSGSGGGAAACLESLRRGGRYVQVGLAGKPVTVPLDEVVYSELTVTSGFASTPRSWRRALALIESRAVALEPLVSEVAPLGDWERVFAETRAGRGVKYVLDPRL